MPDAIRLFTKFRVLYSILYFSAASEMEMHLKETPVPVGDHTYIFGAEIHLTLEMYVALRNLRVKYLLFHI
jgi:hypothetical protein